MNTSVTSTPRTSALLLLTIISVIDFMVDLSRHHGLHPYVVSADVVGSGEDARGSWQDWRLVERPRLGPLRYTIRFPARMVRLSPVSMLGDVRAAPGCLLRTETSAAFVDGATVLSETTTVSAPLPLVAYMTSQARVAHARTYSLLPGEFTAAR